MISRSLLVKLPLATLSVALILTTAISPAFADHIQCGDVITQDTTLDSDLLACPGDGGVIGASGVTLALAGHTLDGTRASGSAGVNNRAGHDGVTVTHGVVRDFGASVDLRKQQGGEVNHLVTGNISLIDSSDIRIERNVAGGGIGLLWESDRVLIARNEVDGGVILQGNPPVFGVGGFPDDVIIDRNTVRPSMALFQAPNATVTRNRVVGSPSYDGLAGIHIRGSLGRGTLADRNEVSGATIGILVSNTDATLTRNLVSDNATDGIQVVTTVQGFPRNARIDRNRAERNGDDGIDVHTASVPALPRDEPPTITRNFASFNGDLGIEAVPEVIDGGGNKAHGNGNPLQCLNVRCK